MILWNICVILKCCNNAISYFNYFRPLLCFKILLWFNDKLFLQIKTIWCIFFIATKWKSIHISEQTAKVILVFHASWAMLWWISNPKIDLLYFLNGLIMYFEDQSLIITTNRKKENWKQEKMFIHSFQTKIPCEIVKVM